MIYPLTKGVRNRSPWQVNVRNRPTLSRVFPVHQKERAQACVEALLQEGHKATLVQQEISFEVRVRRAGIKDQNLTFDTRAQAVQARY